MDVADNTAWYVLTEDAKGEVQRAEEDILTSCRRHITYMKTVIHPYRHKRVMDSCQPVV